uniref:NADH dehydrogenase subunit 2 n=1 Tax=Navicula ramosissima TaxID=265559 RepID=A0A343A6U1_9STRA|nr:NADH dehydrogenase subunit 2 [Navicula ramosissima]AOY40379.1 NADH dehydrogenase subunit 2 [Navicula ramosissima]
MSFDGVFLSMDYIKIQELTFLPEYFLLTALFCLTLFALFTFTFSSKEANLNTRFQYDNQMIFLQVFVIACYLVLVLQQSNISLLGLNGFNDLLFNDPLAITSKFVIGISSILYLLFITKYLKDQKLNNFEYYIILLTSIFGFFLLCCANDFITAYLAIELQGLAFYVLASFKKSSNFSVESGIKYFVLGSLSTALFLLGITFIYGISGSILLTDFKDFFVWAFSANSIVLGANSMGQFLETFQEKVGLIDGSNLEKLNTMGEKLSLLDNNFDNAEVSNSSALNSLKGYADFENSYQDVSAEFLNVLDVSQLDYENFIKFKNSLLNSNYYEDEDLEKFYGLSSENLSELSNVQNISTNLAGDSYFDTIYHVLAGFSVDKDLLSSFSAGAEYENIVTSQSYMDSVIQIANINRFFFALSEMETAKFSSTFDFDFAIFGLIIILLALFFKLALAPFHLWSPDVYEGSPSSSTFFFMVLSKFGIFVFLLRLCYFSFYSFIPYWQFYSIIVASISIFVGSVAGLKQRKLKSLLTYSSINNMGFVLLAFSVGGFEGIQVKFYYLMVYILASVCIWSIVLNLQLKKNHYFEKQNRDLGDLALLQESNPILAQNLGITLFSLAGLPPMVGFLAKMGVFKALSGISVYYFSVINILFSVIATFYYLRITKIIFFVNILVGNLYATIYSKKVFIINLLTFLLVFLFFNPMFLYLYSYKITLFFK